MLRRALTILFIAQWACATAMAQWNLNSRNGSQRAAQAVEQRIARPFDNAAAEDSCLDLLKDLKNGKFLSVDDKMRLPYLAEEVQKNRIGTRAANVELVTADGTTLSLLDSTSAQLTLVYFNDPDCDACQQVKQRLDTCSLLRHQAQAGILRVLAIYTGDNEVLWRNSHMPNYVLNCWNQDQSIDGDETYFLPSLPQFYLLDSSNRVLVKNQPSLNRIIDAVKNSLKESEAGGRE